MHKFTILSVSMIILLVALALPVFAQIDPTPTGGAAQVEPTMQPTTQPQTESGLTGAQATPQATARPIIGTMTEEEMAAQAFEGPSTAQFISENFIRMGDVVNLGGFTNILSSGVPYTIFVPNDGAFITMLNELEISLGDLYSNPALLQGILNYHMLPGRITTDEIWDGTDILISSQTTRHDETLSFGFNPETSRIVINGGEASIEQADIVLGNGIVHIIDNVLTPPNVDELLLNPFMGVVTEEADTQPVLNLEQISENSFVRLTEVIEAAGLSEELASGEYTLFAPNDGAFVTLLNDLEISYEEFLQNQSLLESVLTYHLVPGTVTAEDIQNGSINTAATVNGANLNLGYNMGLSRVTINNGAATIEQPNIFASNGVMHVIDNVLLPPSLN